MLKNRKLSALLSHKLELTPEELESCRVRGLTNESVIKVGELWYTPREVLSRRFFSSVEMPGELSDRQLIVNPVQIHHGQQQRIAKAQAKAAKPGAIARLFGTRSSKNRSREETPQMQLNQVS